MVSSGVAAATTASTIAAGAFIGTASVYGMAVVFAALTSTSVSDFNDKGNWGVVATTALGGITGAASAYGMYRAQTQTISNTKSSTTSEETFLPDSFYSKHAPKQNTPGSVYTNHTYNSYTGKYEKSTAYYDFAGRQQLRIDWTNHGYIDHGYPHIHYTVYNSQYPDGITIRWD